MPAQELPGTTALVTGANRGFGRAITIALAKHGAHVVGVARDRARLEELYAQLGDTFTPVSADAADPVVAGRREFAKGFCSEADDGAGGRSSARVRLVQGLASCRREGR